MVVLGIIGILYSIRSFTEEFGQIPNSFAEFAEDQKSIYVSIAGIGVGFVIFYLEKLLAWWNHG